MGASSRVSPTSNVGGICGVYLCGMTYQELESVGAGPTSQRQKCLKHCQIHDALCVDETDGHIANVIWYGHNHCFSKGDYEDNSEAGIEHHCNFNQPHIYTAKDK